MIMSFKSIIFLLISTIISVILVENVVESGNILYLLTTPSKSHNLWHQVLIQKLYTNGHNLTILSLDQGNSLPGKSYIVMEDVYRKIGEKFENNMDNQSENPFVNLKAMYEFYNLASKFMTETNGIKALLQYPKSFQFDLIIYDFTMGQSLLGFVEYFGNPPLVAVSPFNIPSYTTFLVSGMNLNTNYMPHFTSNYGTNMAFIERIKNSLYWAFDLFYRQKIFMPNENLRARKLFGKALTDVRVIEKQTDLILANCDFSIDYPLSLPPNVIPVGGLQIKRQEPLVKIAKEFIARAKKGVVFLSFGTNLKNNILGNDVILSILEIFSSLPDYNFIWKIENPPFERIPSNVLTLEWVQQNAVLASDRCKLFITHGGLLSIQEAIWHGVPMIGLPFFGDQHQNVEKIVRFGIGEKIPLKTFDKFAFNATINKILANSNYTSMAEMKSQQFRHQPEHPLDRATFWIEKVIENRGLSYLRSPRENLAFYKIYMLDVFFIIFLILLGYYVIIRRHINSNKKKDKVE